ncbi:Cobalamin-binding protein [Candidatus Electronema halotolerans]
MKRLVLLAALLLCLLPLEDSSAARPQRIVSLGPMNTENVFLLGAGDRLVGTTTYCVRPPAAKEKAKVGSVMQFSVEKLLALRPDLVLATGLTSPPQMDKLRRLGLKVVQFRQPDSFAQVCGHFRQLGTLLGLEDKAEEVIQQAQAKVEAIAAAAAKLPKQKVFLQIGASPLFGAAPDSFTQDYITLSNSSNILAGQFHGTVSREKVIDLNPDVILIAMMGSESGGLARQEKETWQGFPFLSAVQRGQVHVISPNLVCSPSPATFASTLAVIAKLIHPDLPL